MVKSTVVGITPANHAASHIHGGTDPLLGDIRSTYVYDHATKHDVNGSDVVDQNNIMRMIAVDDIVVGANGRLYNMLLPPEATALVGSWTLTENAAYYCNLAINNGGSPADAMSFYWDIWLDAGTYDLALWCRESTSYGILDVYLDAVQVASFDCYDGATQSSMLQDTGNVVASSGFYRVTCVIDGKNGASSDYNMYVSALGFRRVA